VPNWIDMKWITIQEEFPPSNKWVLVKYLRAGGYAALRFKNDQEYGFVAATPESYVTPMELEKWCLIED
jgi:hypothetical protein